MESKNKVVSGIFVKIPFLKCESAKKLVGVLLHGEIQRIKQKDKWSNLYGKRKSPILPVWMNAAESYDVFEHSVAEDAILFCIAAKTHQIQLTLVSTEPHQWLEHYRAQNESFDPDRWWEICYIEPNLCALHFIAIATLEAGKFTALSLHRIVRICKLGYTHVNQGNVAMRQCWCPRNTTPPIHSNSTKCFNYFCHFSCSKIVNLFTLFWASAYECTSCRAQGK